MASISFDAGELDEVVERAVLGVVKRIKDSGALDSPERLLLDKRQAAKAMAISVSTLDRLTAPRGALQCVRLDGRVLYSLEAIREWIGAQEGRSACGRDLDVEG